ncbi:MAG: hypothetical protein WEB89_11960, partial [Balneolales bacterium]
MSWSKKKLKAMAFMSPLKGKQSRRCLSGCCGNLWKWREAKFLTDKILTYYYIIAYEDKERSEAVLKI